MIVQFTDVIDKNKYSGNIGNFSDQRFYHDRKFSINKNIYQPYLGGTLDGERQSFILHFKISPATVAKIIKIRGLNATIKDIKPNVGEYSNWEVIINVEKTLNHNIFILFESLPVYGEWKLIFGNEDWWMHCDATFEHISLIRVSEPLDDYTISLPRFIVNPEYAYESLGEDLRGDVGQPYGRTVRQLKTFSVTFARVSSNLIDSYYHRVGLTEPHFIVPYPENVYNVPPIWATLTEPPRFTKRAEDSWYYDTQLTWREAY